MLAQTFGPAIANILLKPKHNIIQQKEKQFELQRKMFKFEDQILQLKLKLFVLQPKSLEVKYEWTENRTIFYCKQKARTLKNSKK